MANVFQHDEDDSLPEYHDDSDDDGVPHIRGCLYGGPNKSFRMEVMDDDWRGVYTTKPNKMI